MLSCFFAHRSWKVKIFLISIITTYFPRILCYSIDRFVSNGEAFILIFVFIYIFLSFTFMWLIIRLVSQCPKKSELQYRNLIVSWIHLISSLNINAIVLYNTIALFLHYFFSFVILHSIVFKFTTGFILICLVNDK